jgi:quercetin dioxygenase-like cupin family protein
MLLDEGDDPGDDHHDDERATGVEATARHGLPFFHPVIHRRRQATAMAGAPTGWLTAALLDDRRGAVPHAGRRNVLHMDVRSITEVEPEVEHNGTVPVWYLVHPREMKQLTDGGYLELVNEFEVAAGGYVYPHSHPTHEFYFVMSGRGVMTIAGEDRDVAPGDLVYIPPDDVHSLRPIGGGAIHCFCFAVAVKGAPEIDYTSHE